MNDVEINGYYVKIVKLRNQPNEFLKYLIKQLNICEEDLMMDMNL